MALRVVKLESPTPGVIGARAGRAVGGGGNGRGPPQRESRPPGTCPPPEPARVLTVLDAFLLDLPNVGRRTLYKLTVDLV